MPDRSDPKRDAIHDKLVELGPAFKADAAILVGWVIVTDWMDGDDNRWLSKAHSSNLPRWVSDGLHHEALYGDWPENDEEEDDDDGA